MEISKIILILYIVMIPVSYKIQRHWAKEWIAKNNAKPWSYGDVCFFAFMSIIWPLSIPIAFFMFKAKDKTPPSWL